MSNATVSVNVTQSPNYPSIPYVDAWIDFNRDGVWDSATERILTGQRALGVTQIQFDVPAWAAYGLTHARFRVSSQGGLGPVGEAYDGEVEDVEVFIAAPTKTSDIFTSLGVLGSASTTYPIHEIADLDGDGDNDVVFLDGKIA